MFWPISHHVIYLDERWDLVGFIQGFLLIRSSPAARALVRVCVCVLNLNHCKSPAVYHSKRNRSREDRKKIYQRNSFFLYFQKLRLYAHLRSGRRRCAFHFWHLQMFWHFYPCRRRPFVSFSLLNVINVASLNDTCVFFSPDLFF